jgi:hypothetical protein
LFAPPEANEIDLGLRLIKLCFVKMSTALVASEVVFHDTLLDDSHRLVATAFAFTSYHREPNANNWEIIFYACFEPPNDRQQTAGRTWLSG